VHDVEHGVVGPGLVEEVAVDGPHGAALLHHHDGPGARPFQPLGRDRGGIVRRAGGHVLDVAAHEGAGVPLDRQAEGHPVHLAVDVVVHLAEAVQLEQARCPGAEVSEGVEAVDDDRAVGIELAGPLPRQLPGMDVDRPRQVGLAVLLLLEDLEDLGAGLDELLGPAAVDALEHWLLLGGRRPGG
jgi:hypothetical protein